MTNYDSDQKSRLVQSSLKIISKLYLIRKVMRGFWPKYWVLCCLFHFVSKFYTSGWADRWWQGLAWAPLLAPCPPCHLVKARLGQSSAEELQHSNGLNGLKATSATGGYIFTITIGDWWWQRLARSPLCLPCHLVMPGLEFNCCWKVADSPKRFVWISRGGWWGSV